MFQTWMFWKTSHYQKSFKSGQVNPNLNNSFFVPILLDGSCGLRCISDFQKVNLMFFSLNLLPFSKCTYFVLWQCFLSVKAALRILFQRSNGYSSGFDARVCAAAWGFWRHKPNVQKSRGDAPGFVDTFSQRAGMVNKEILNSSLSKYTVFYLRNMEIKYNRLNAWNIGCALGWQQNIYFEFTCTLDHGKRTKVHVLPNAIVRTHKHLNFTPSPYQKVHIQNIASEENMGMF